MNIDTLLLKRYLEGKTTEEERYQIINWFFDLKAEKDLIEQSRDYWNEMQSGISDEDYDESVILGRIYRDIKMRESAEKLKPKVIVRLMDFLVKTAAVLFIPLLVLYLSRDKIREKNADSEITYSEIYSPLGSRTMFYLPDGSRGWLNGGSYLKYAEGFPGKTRDVILRGEAFFDVKTNPRKPFIVTGKNLNIVATGTSFNVMAREDEQAAEIVLVEGKLDIYQNTHKGKELITSSLPGELLHYLPQTTGSYIQKVDVDKYVSWTKGRLIFREDPFTDVVKRINRWYNVNIIIKDKILESYKYVATFQDETLDEVLKMLTVSAPISYRNLPRKQLGDGTFEKRTIELYYRPHKIKKTNPMSN